MVKINEDQHRKMKGQIAGLENDRWPWWKHWRDIADMYLPRRYVYLLSPQERVNATKNDKILDSTGTIAARTLASGMMNGITSPSRQWFKLRIAGLPLENEPKEVRVWLDQTQETMQLIMAESNFYNAIAVLYMDLVVFGTASMLIYEDFESVIRCFNPALGEFYFAQSDRLQVNTFSREFTYKVHQIVAKWGLENCSPQVQDAYRMGGARLQDDHTIIHLVEPNIQDSGVPKRFEYRETYWEKSGPLGTVLEQRGFFELPGIFPRWDLTGNEAYGSSPAMDAYGDVVQLQHETKAKGQGLDMMMRPPLQADVQLQHKPTAILPGGITWVTGLASTGNLGVRPVYQVNPPLGEMTQDVAQLQGRIREIFHNDLFRIISQLETVRTATEIDSLREEKLVLLGPVLERFENEALDPAVQRIFNIAARAGLLPEAPEGLEEAQLEIQYVGVLSAAQRAVGTASTERFLQVIGSVAPLWPEARHVPNITELLSDYGRDIGVDAKGLNTPEEVEAKVAQEQQKAEAAQQIEAGAQLAEAGKTLSETQVGGGVNALEIISGGAG